MAMQRVDTETELLSEGLGERMTTYLTRPRNLHR